jgi:hypothetical protein
VTLVRDRGKGKAVVLGILKFRVRVRQCYLFNSVIVIIIIIVNVRRFSRVLLLIFISALSLIDGSVFCSHRITQT